MTSFRHDRPGIAPHRWWEHPGRAGVADLDLVDRDGGPLRRLVVVAAHPDDETLGAGGLMAAASGSGLAVEVVVLTDGEASHPHSPTHSPVTLAAVRREECRRAVERLGHAITLSHLGLPDGAVAESEPGCVDRLTELVGDGRGVLLVAPWRRDGHPDHEAAGRVAAAVAARTGARLLEYPVWFWHWAEPDRAPWAAMTRLALEPATLEAKRRAVAEHRSQVSGLSTRDGDEPLLTESLLAHFLAPQELFVEEPPSDPALELLHRDVLEPWGADTRWYEERKRALLLAMLPDRRLGRVLELGCSTGVTSLALATRSEELVAVDSSESAVAAASARLAGIAGVDVRHGVLPDDWPPGCFDVVVVSELGYFLDPGALDRTVDAVRSCLAEEGVVLLCHWRPPVVGWVLDGADVHTAFAAAPGWNRLASYLDADVELLLLGPAGRLPEPTR